MEFKDQYILLQDTFLGDIQVRYYGIIIVTAMLVAAFVAAQLAQRRKLDPDHVWGGLTWAIFPGIIGARLWFVIFPPISLTVGCGSTDPGAICKDFAWFMANFSNLTDGPLAIWSGGLSIFGAVLGGLLGAWLYCSPYHNTVAKFFYYLFSPITFVLGLIAWIPTIIFQRIRGQETAGYRFERFKTDFPDAGLPVGPWLDIAGVVLPLAQFIGRFANAVNQELYGIPTTLPWGIPIDTAHRVGEYTNLVEYPLTNPTTLFHPLFLYEGLWSLAAFFVLLNLYNRQYRKFVPGDFFLLYLMQYSFIRFLLEFLRVEIATVPGTSLNSSQAFTVLVFVVAAVIFFYRRRNGVPAAQAEQEAATA